MDRFWYFVGANTFYLLMGPAELHGGFTWPGGLAQRKISLQESLQADLFFCRRSLSGVGIYLLWKWIFNADYGLVNSRDCDGCFTRLDSLVGVESLGKECL